MCRRDREKAALSHDVVTRRPNILSPFRSQSGPSENVMNAARMRARVAGTETVPASQIPRAQARTSLKTAHVLRVPLEYVFQRPSSGASVGAMAFANPQPLDSCSKA